MKYILAGLTLLLFIFTGCSSVKMDSPESAEKLVEFSKSACYGNCPHYQMVVNTDGSVLYTGKRNVERMGVYKHQLTKKEYTTLAKTLKKADLYQFEDVYNPEIQDGQVTRVVYHGADGTKKIAMKLRLPEGMEESVAQLDNIANSPKEWTAIDVPPSNSSTMDTEGDIIVKEDQPTQKVFAYSQGACFGKCPVFSLDVLSDGTALLVGKRFTDKQGIYEKKLSAKTYEKLIALVEASEFQSLEDSYDTDVMDAQQYTITYYDINGRAKKVITKFSRPGNLEQIINMVQALENNRGWEMKKGADSENVDDSILISLKPQVKAKKWIATKSHLDLKVIRYLSPKGTYFLVSYNKELDIERVMEELRRDRDVLAVSKGNQPAKPRTGGTTKSVNKGKSNVGGK